MYTGDGTKSPSPQGSKSNPSILTWMGDSRPRNKTIWVVLDVESEVEVQDYDFLPLDLARLRNVCF